jgi:hypothetical protein
MDINGERPVTGEGDEARKVVQLFPRDKRYSATTYAAPTPAVQTANDFATAAFGNAAIGLERRSLRMIELGGRCAVRALGA